MVRYLYLIATVAMNFEQSFGMQLDAISSYLRGPNGAKYASLQTAGKTEESDGNRFGAASLITENPSKSRWSLAPQPRNYENEKKAYKRTSKLGGPLVMARLELETKSCGQTNQYSEDGFSRVLENFELTRTLQISGPEWDNTLVRNCRIHNTDGPGIFIGNVRDVVIYNCEIWNSKRGIQVGHLGDPSSGTENVTIDGNHIHDTYGDGISASQRSSYGMNQVNIRLLNNRIENAGASRSDGHSHPIYVQSSDFLIEGNVISGTRDGNGISVRSSGIVRCNSISGISNARKPAIRYYSNHMTGPSDTLVLEQNKLISNSTGIELEAPTAMEQVLFGERSRTLRFLHRAWLQILKYLNWIFEQIGVEVPLLQQRAPHVVGNFVVRDNLILAPESISIDKQYFDPFYNVRAYGNRCLVLDPLAQNKDPVRGSNSPSEVACF